MKSRTSTCTRNVAHTYVKFFSNTNCVSSQNNLNIATKIDIIIIKIDIKLTYLKINLYLYLNCRIKTHKSIT